MSKFDAREYLRNKRKDEEEEDKKKQQNVKSETFNARDYLNQKNIASKIGFDTFSDDLNTMNTTLSGIYGGWQDKDTMTSTRAKVEETYNRLLDYEDYRNNYGDDSFTDLSELMNTYKSALDDWENLAEVYGQYENAEAYTSAVKKAKEKTEADEKLRKEMLSADMDVQNAKTHALEYHLGEVQKLEKNIHKEKVQQNSDGYKSASQELDNYLADIGYSSIEELESAISNQKKFVRDSAVLQDEQKILGSADFAKYSAIGAKIGNPNYEDAQQLNFFGHMYGGTPLGNKLKFAKDHKDKIISDTHSAMTPGGTGIPVSIYYTSANDEEQRIYEYYLGQEREGKAEAGTADKYLDSILPRLKARHEGEMITNLDTFTKEHPVIGSVASVGLSLGSGVEYVAEGIDYARTGILDDNFNARASSAIRSRVSEDYDWNVDLGIIKGDAFDFLYNTTMSGIDSGVAAATLGGWGGVALGLSAAASATNDALDRGFTDEQALKQGFMSGAFEMLFESLSIGIFLNEDASKGLLRNLATSMFVNASEEMATEAANIAYDLVANKDLSNYVVRVQELVDSGMPKAEAVRKVALEFGAQIAEAGASGAVMGGGFTTINSAKYGVYTNSLGKAIRNNENVGNVVDLASVQLSPEEKSAYEAYERYAKKGINAENINNGKLGNLAYSLGADAEAVLDSEDSTPEERARAEQVLRDLDAYTQNTSASRFGEGRVKQLYGDKEKVQTLIDNALKKGEGTEAYKLATEYKKKIESGKELSEKELTKLVDVTTSGIKDTVKVDAEQKLRDLGETENAVELSKIISKAATGQMLSSAETEAIANNENARKVFAEMDKSSNIELMEASEAYEGGDAELFLENYEGGDIDKYRASFDFVSSLAKNNYDADFILEHRGALTPRQVQNIYSKVVAEPRAEQQRKLDELVKKHEGQLVRKANIDDSIFNGAKGQKLWRNLNSRQKKAITFVKAFAKGAGINLKITYDGTYNGKAYNGYYDHDTNTIVIDARAGFNKRYISEDAIIPTMSHELTHWMKQKSPELYAKLSKQIFDVFKAKGYTEYDLIATEQGKHPDMSDDAARDEIIARACEDLFKMSEEGKKIFDSLSEAEKKTLVGKIKELIQNLVDWANELLGLYESRSDEAGWLREFKDELSEIAKTWDQMLAKAVEVNAALEGELGKIDAERITSNELDVSYSLKYNGDIAEGQLEWLDKNKGHITEAELKEAQEVTRAMVDVMMKHSEILPEDKIGKVLTKNGSYDRSVENTTICVRTLAYNEFVDKVQEEIGRPLTQMESFLVSQKLYDIATEPQCLYCYVSLDRKAFNDMLLRYMTERDTVIAKYNNSDKSAESIKKLYEEFLHGRKDTKEMKSRFDKWISAVDNGTQLLSLADIATEERQSDIKAKGGILAEQLADARKYAQSASWSKIQKNYVAYRDEILKLGDRVVKNLNEHYGLRWYSFSDYSAAFIVENMQQITDASIRGLKGLAYTKDTDFVEIFASTGMNINVSVFVNQDADGNFFIDEKQSANFEKAVELRKKYPNVGIVATVTNDEALRWAGEQEWSDVIIPFHIVRTGTDVAEYYKWLNYTSESGDTIADKNLWDAYVDSLNLSSDNARKKVSKNIYPSEHKNNKDTYLSLCESRGLSPRFARFAGEAWYMKLVNETRLSADDSSSLKPEFNLDAAKDSFQKFIDKGGYEGGWYKEGVDVDAEAKTVARDVLAGKKANEVEYGRQDGFVPEDLVASRKSNRTHGKASGMQFSEKDTEYLELAKNPEKNEAKLQKIVDKAAVEAGVETDKHGKPVKLYHGTTQFGFTSIDLGKMDDKISLFATSSLETAGTYSGTTDVRRISSANEANTQIDLSRYEKRAISESEKIIKIFSKYSKGNEEIDRFGIAEKMADSIKKLKAGVFGVEVSYDFREFVDNAYYDFEAEYEDVYTDSEMSRIYFKKNDIVDKISELFRNHLADKSNQGIYAFYGKTDNFLVLKQKKNEWNDLEYEGEVYTTRTLAEKAYKDGYYGVKIEKIFDDGGRGIKDQRKPADIYIFFKPEEQIWSADPVTYDDEGNVIPISQRFNSEKNDIRFSEKDTGTSAYDIIGEKKALEKRYNKLAADFANYKERVKLDKTLTKGKVIDPKQLEAVARYLVKYGESDYKASELAKVLNDLYVDIQDGAMDDSMSWDEMYSKAYEVAKEIRSEAKVKIERPAYYDMILKDIRSARIAPNDGQKGDAKHRFGEHYVGKFRGRVTIANDGTPLDIKWSEWASKYPSVFDKDIGDAQQLVELYDIYDDLRNAGDVVQEYEESEVLQSLATEIINKAWTVTKFESTADKQNKRIQELNAEHRKAMEELRESYEAKATATNNELELYQKLYGDMWSKRREAYAKAKELGRKKLARYKENAERRVRIQRITNNSLTLNKWLVKNSKEEHIHEALKTPVINLLNAIDFSSKRMIDKGIPTNKDISLAKALGKVKDMMVKASNGHADFVQLYGHGLDEKIEKMMESIDMMDRTIADNEFILQKMSLEDLETLDKVVRTIKASVSKLNKFHVANHKEGIASLSRISVKDMNSLGKGKVYDGMRGKIDKTLMWNNALPAYAFERFGEGGKIIFGAIQDGWDKFAFNVKKALDYAEEAYTSKEVTEWEKDVKTFKILVPTTEADIANPDYEPEYQNVQMTIPQIMSLYCMAKREQAKGHILGGGIRVADFSIKKKLGEEVITQEEGAVLTAKDIESIIGTLTDRQKAVADKLQKFMNTVCTEWGNEVSMARFGYKAFGEENYFPIKSDDNNLSNDPTDAETSLFRLLNMSFTKSLTEGANNRVIISDIFDVFAQHASDMAKYNSLALPVLDAFQWYNYTEKQDVGDEGNFKTQGVKQAMEKAFGKDGQNYFTTFLKDINGQKEVSRDTVGSGFFSNAKIAAVGANLRVVALQPTSYVRASAVIDNKYLAKAFGYKDELNTKGREKAEKYCGIALWKSMGYYDTNIQRGVTEQIKHKETWKDKATEISMKGAEWADKLTWGYLWNACELEIRDTRKDLKVGSEEFYDAIAKRLREVIYKTQVVDSTMTRSQLMRSGQFYDKMLTSFASEPTLAYNMLMESFNQASLDTRKMGRAASWKKNGKNIARTIAAYTMTNALAALVESAFDAYRDDDDEEKDLAYFAKLYFSNFGQDMSVTGKIPYIKELHSLFKGFSASRTDTQWMESLAKSLTEWGKIATTDKGNPVKAVKETLRTFSYITGLPFYNAYRDAMAGLDKVGILTTEDLEEMLEDIFG